MARTGVRRAGRSSRPARFLMAAVAVCILATGCQVSTTVRVATGGDGHGVVSVSVTLDRAALDEIGGQAALAAQLQVQDLQAAGWSVTGPAAGPGSTTIITASHPFSAADQAGQLLADLAGSGSANAPTRPFRLTLVSHHSFWNTTTSLNGAVDLRCGLNCFGDAALRSLTGSSVGVNPAPLERASGEQPGKAFTFSVVAQLPGSIQRTDAPVRQGTTVQWRPQLGQSVVVSAVTESWDWARIIGLGAACLLVLLIVAGWVGRRWFRAPGRGRPGRHRPGTAVRDESVESPAGA